MNFQVHATRTKILMFCLDLKRDNKNCSSVVTYNNCFEVISMNFQVQAHFTKKVSAITKIVAPLQRTITVSRL